MPNVSQPYTPPRPITGVNLLSYTKLITLNSTYYFTYIYYILNKEVKCLEGIRYPAVTVPNMQDIFVYITGFDHPCKQKGYG
jgi:hypothetical protein